MLTLDGSRGLQLLTIENSFNLTRLVISFWTVLDAEIQNHEGPSSCCSGSEDLKVGFLPPSPVQECWSKRSGKCLDGRVCLTWHDVSILYISLIRFQYILYTYSYTGLLCVAFIMYRFYCMFDGSKPMAIFQLGEPMPCNWWTGASKISCLYSVVGKQYTQNNATPSTLPLTMWCQKGVFRKLEANQTTSS